VTRSRASTVQHAPTPGSGPAWTPAGRADFGRSSGVQETPHSQQHHSQRQFSQEQYAQQPQSVTSAYGMSPHRVSGGSMRGRSATIGSAAQGRRHQPLVARPPVPELDGDAPQAARDARHGIESAAAAAPRSSRKSLGRQDDLDADDDSFPGAGSSSPNAHQSLVTSPGSDAPQRRPRGETTMNHAELFASFARSRGIATSNTSQDSPGSSPSSAAGSASGWGGGAPSVPQVAPVAPSVPQVVPVPNAAATTSATNGNRSRQSKSSKPEVIPFADFEDIFETLGQSGEAEVSFVATEAPPSGSRRSSRGGGFDGITVSPSPAPIKHRSRAMTASAAATARGGFAHSGGAEPVIHFVPSPRTDSREQDRRQQLSRNASKQSSSQRAADARPDHSPPPASSSAAFEGQVTAAIHTLTAAVTEMRQEQARLAEVVVSRAGSPVSVHDQQDHHARGHRQGPGAFDHPSHNPSHSHSYSDQRQQHQFQSAPRRRAATVAASAGGGAPGRQAILPHETITFAPDTVRDIDGLGGPRSKRRKRGGRARPARNNDDTDDHESDDADDSGDNASDANAKAARHNGADGELWKLPKTVLVGRTLELQRRLREERELREALLARDDPPAASASAAAASGEWDAVDKVIIRGAAGKKQARPKARQGRGNVGRRRPRAPVAEEPESSYSYSGSSYSNNYYSYTSSGGESEQRVVARPPPRRKPQRAGKAGKFVASGQLTGMTPRDAWVAYAKQERRQVAAAANPGSGSRAKSARAAGRTDEAATGGAARRRGVSPERADHEGVVHLLWDLSTDAGMLR
jgi:hypothetical protein